MTPKFFDLDGVERGLQWAVDKYHIVFLEAPGTFKFALVEVLETTGVAEIAVIVQNELGGPQYHQPVAQSWPLLHEPSPDLKPSPVDSRTNWSERCMFVETDSGGKASFPYGGDAVMHGDGGPLAYWVLSPTAESDGLAKIGWDGATNHTALGTLVFRLVKDAPEPPPYDGYVSVKPIYDVAGCQEALAEVDSLDPGADIDTPDGDRAHVLKILIFDFERFLWLDQPWGWKCRLAEWLCPRAFE